MKILEKLKQKMPVSREEYDKLYTLLGKLQEQNDLIQSILGDIAVIIEGLKLSDSQHSQIESNLIKIVMAKKPQKILSKADNKDTNRSYM